MKRNLLTTNLLISLFDLKITKNNISNNENNNINNNDINENVAKNEEEAVISNLFNKGLENSFIALNNSSLFFKDEYIDNSLNDSNHYSINIFHNEFDDDNEEINNQEANGFFDFNEIREDFFLNDSNKDLEFNIINPNLNFIDETMIKNETDYSKNGLLFINSRILDYFNDKNNEEYYFANNSFINHNSLKDHLNESNFNFKIDNLFDFKINNK